MHKHTRHLSDFALEVHSDSNIIQMRKPNQYLKGLISKKSEENHNSKTYLRTTHELNLSDSPETKDTHTHTHKQWKSVEQQRVRGL